MNTLARIPPVAVVVVIVSVAALGWPQASAAPEPKPKSEQTELPMEKKQMARLIVANELMRLHWTSWVSGRELKEIAKEAAKGINEQLENRWDGEFLLPEARARPQRLATFEKQAIDDIQAGVTEVWRDTPEGVQYVRGIRATTTCAKCHQPLGTPRGELQEGDLLGIISVKLMK